MSEYVNGSSLFCVNATSQKEASYSKQLWLECTMVKTHH